MKQIEIKEVKKQITTDIICDCCGKSCMVNKGIIDNVTRVDNGEPFYDFSFMTMETNWGFFSNKDSEKWTAQVCETCVDEKFSFVKFKKDINK